MIRLCEGCTRRRAKIKAWTEKMLAKRRAGREMAEHRAQFGGSHGPTPQRAPGPPPVKQ